MRHSPPPHLRVAELAAAGMLTAGVVIGPAAPAARGQPPAEYTYFVAATGAGNADDTGPGTIDQPLATLAEAQRRARESAVQADGDVAVNLLDGTFRLGSPLRFDAADSGRNGHTVTWQAASGAQPVLTGAQPVTGWELDDTAAGVYRADVGTGFDTRQLYVDGVLAQRARISLSPPDISLNPTGFTINNPGLAFLATLPDQQRIELQALLSWTNRFSPIQSISGSTVVMQQPAWDNNTYGWDTIQNPLRGPTLFLLNSRSFLDEPGEWYLDTTAGTLYYQPLKSRVGSR